MGMVRRLRVLAVVLAGFWLWACERTPDQYDYHGPRPDVGISDGWTTQDLPPMGDVDAGDPGKDIPTQGDADSIEDSVQDLGIPDGPATDLTDAETPLERQRECKVVFSFDPPDDSVPAVASEAFVSQAGQPWAESEKVMSDAGGGKYSLEVDVSTITPGSYGYKFHTQADGWFIDPSNPLSKFSDGFENSKFIVDDCGVPEIKLKSFDVKPADGEVTVVAEVYDGVGSAGIVPSSAELYVNGEKKAAPYDSENGIFDVKLTGLKKGSKVDLKFNISNSKGPARPLYVPLWISSDDWSWRDASMYFAFTDRFKNGDVNNDAPAGCDDAPESTRWRGGDFAGIAERIEAGYFDDMGINALWISPVVDNPDGCFSGNLAGIKYTAYHGYFPVDFWTTENHFGSMAELRSMVNKAHEHGIRVLIDFVGNHCHTESPLWAEHSEDGWFNSFTPCEPAWDKPVECWFQNYLPDFDYTKDPVVEFISDNAIFWIMETGVDGFRVDAVKHMSHNFIRTVRYKVDKYIEQPTGLMFYMVGETFMGEWGGGTGDAEKVIKEYVNDWELNGQFDFPFYWKLLKAAGRNEGTFGELGSFLTAALPYWGPDAIMVSFIGNHDVPRFASHAAGQIADMWGNGSKEQGITNPPVQPDDEATYAKTALAIGLSFTLPEIPLIYYGDEIGLAGAGDPDNRRMMVWDNLTGRQQGLLDFVKLVGIARRDNAALRRGDLTVLKSEADELVFRRSAAGSTVFVAANRSAGSKTIQIPMSGVSGNVAELVSGDTIAVNGGSIERTLDGYGIEIFVVQ